MGALLGLLMNPRVLMGLGLAAVLAFAGVQSWRVGRLQNDVRTVTAERNTARAALINPASRRTWEADYTDARRDLAACRENTVTLRAGIEAQGAAVRQQAAQSAARLQTAQAALAVALRRQPAAERGATVILRPTTGATACDRLSEIDQRVLGGLQ